MRGAITRWAAICSALVTVSPVLAAAQSGPVVVAILPFEDRGSYGQDKEVFRAFESSLPSTLAGELSARSRVRIADAQRISQAVQAENLPPGTRMDAATAARVASQAGARYAVTGHFADFYGRLRIDARVIDARNGQILKVVSNTDPDLQDRANLSRIIQDLAGKILVAVGARNS